MNHALRSLTDDELLSRTVELLAGSRRIEAELVAHLAEVDHRRLYRREACPSMFVYATARLGLSEAEAYLRITVGRMSRRFPAVLDLLRSGRIHLSAIAKLAPHLTDGNAEALLGRAAGRSKREVEELVAELAPKGDAPALVRRVAPPPPPVSAPELRPDGAGAAPRLQRPGRETESPAKVMPLAPARYKVQFTASGELEGKIARARALLRHRIPSGDLAAIIDRALTVLIGELERGKCAATASPRRSLAQTSPAPSSRRVPAAVRRAVWQRDGARCTFVDAEGRRCPATEALEFHHEVPFARGGDHDAANVRLLCRSHNVYRAELDFGTAYLRVRPEGAAIRR